MERYMETFEPFYSGVASAVEKAGELAAGVEAWLVGSVPSRVAEAADAFDSVVRLQLSAVAFGSEEEREVNQLFVVSAQLRSAYRGAAEASRLLALLDPSPAVRACLASPGDRLATQARLAPPAHALAESSADALRLMDDTQRAVSLALLGLPRETLPGLTFATLRMQRACLNCLSVASEGFARASAAVGKA